MTNKKIKLTDKEIGEIIYMALSDDVSFHLFVLLRNMSGGC